MSPIRRLALPLAVLALAQALASCTFDPYGYSFSLCGNGEIDPGEVCDGNDLGGRICATIQGYTGGELRCLPSCQGWDVSGCTTNAVCGNGDVDPGEQCDDGNTQPCDGCSPACGLEVCGNGTVECLEACDDGNTAGCDGCSPTCRVETCGNGVVDCGEECDDGNLEEDDGCDNQCRIVIPPLCGNGEVDPGEQCDDGNNDDCDDCSAVCRHEVCGNGFIDCGEECDDGGTDDCDGCSATCQVEGCGNGVLECDEECDDGGNDDCDGCSANCREEGCGNGVIECGEECEDGNTDNTDSCVECMYAFCGDGYIQKGVEVCEPGNVPSTCEEQGFVGGLLGCAPGCTAFDDSGCSDLTPDGGPCLVDADCAGGVCFAEADSAFPGGFCTRDCTNDPCPNGVCINTFQSDYWCYFTCADPSDCRQGYLCRLDRWMDTHLICRPRCEADGDCPDTGDCNEWSGWCNDGGGSGNVTGAGCDRDDECRGQLCWDGQSFGYCTSPCKLSTGFCPDDSTCSDVGGGAWGDLGYCLENCNVNSDCSRTSKTCKPNPWGTGDVCLDY